MAVPRVLAQSRFALPRGLTMHRATGSILRIVAAAPRQRFSSSARFREELTQTLEKGAETPPSAALASASGSHLRSIAIFRLPALTVPADIEKLLGDVGVDVKRLQFRIDRFTFRGDGTAFVELASEEQAQQATKALHGRTMSGRALTIRPLDEKFYWDSGFQKHDRFFFYDADTPSQAIQPLLDGRRYCLYVENPGWYNKKQLAGRSANVYRKNVIDEHFGPFGIEAMGALNPVWKKDRKNDITFMVDIDFSTKDSAEQAVKALDGQLVHRKRVQLKPFEITSDAAEQIKNIDKDLLARLEQLDVLPKSHKTKAKA